MARGSRYEDNVYNMLKRKGLAQKYEHPGIYSISIDDQLVYIGKSKNMLRRVAEHWVGIKKGSERKYRILAEAQRKGYPINFDVLYYAKEQTRSRIEEEIGQKEGEFIRQYRPILNTQIPKEKDWHKYDHNKLDAKAVLESLL